MATNWDAKFFESTRGRIVVLLRRSGRTVEELARALNLTDNGVRAHLAVLERDGIARQRGSVRRGSGGGKPAYVYELTSEAEELFPKAYEPVLGRLLDVLAQRLGPEESEALLRSLGRSFGSGKEQTNESFIRSGKSSCFVGFDPFRGIPNKKSIRVEWEHYVQGATRILFPCHLEGPQDAIGLHE